MRDPEEVAEGLAGPSAAADDERSGGSVPDDEDVAATHDEWELAGSFRIARGVRDWSIVGGWEEPGAVGLHVVVHHPETDEMIKRLRVRIPVTVDAGDLVVGEAEILA